MIEYITPEKVKSLIANLSHLVFEVTDACNLRCKYCAYGEFYDDYDERNNRYLPIEKAIKLINYLYSQWTSYRNTASKNNILISFYGGEPLLNFRFIKKMLIM
ncbi:MAG: radical SAM protein [Bacteroidaceae bacterium]|nr:radical SAM protein [Bacteroidaceae bacterium]